MAYYDATNEFIEGIEEANILIDLAEKHESNRLAYLALTKSSILIATAKFEAFIENIMSDYWFEIKDISNISYFIPKPILASCIKKLGS